MAHFKGEAIDPLLKTHPRGPEAGSLVKEWLRDFYTAKVWTDARQYNDMPLRWQQAQDLISTLYHRYILHSNRVIF